MIVGDNIMLTNLLINFFVWQITFNVNDDLLKKKANSYRLIREIVFSYLNR